MAVLLRKLLTHRRVDRTFHGLALGGLTEALIAAQARCNIIRLVMQRLVGNIGICQKGAPDLDNIRLAGGNDPLHVGRIIQRTYAGDRLTDSLLDARCQIDVDASRIEG